ncbi:hypothetical protein BamMEX5DRAFT_5852 [Burkholderia ambifaria MEX-5]|uniref:Short-chain dehydrogenase/reductase SDR n=1 Tax=Burkholderia ambifaria MEX-5 TaxID=396597 RepID=B1TDI6_9BURK|nr:hypothetical protein BamMEX5DRAFT_5852 [Burkholderia ambifaria MEX-5]
MWQSVEQFGTDFVRAHRRRSILRRPSTLEEVANMVVYVCSTQASATRGAACQGGHVDPMMRVPSEIPSADSEALIFC